MKKIFLTLLLLNFSSSISIANNWKDSPYNFDNSTMNFQNSSMNFENSPYNFKNSPQNSNANIIYDNNGNPQGYAVPKKNGTGVNIFDFQGNRVNYYNY